MIIYERCVKRMAVKYKKSAKDMAFDRERAKLRKTINELEMDVHKRDKIIASWEEKYSQLAEESSKLREEVKKLLELASMSDKDLQMLLNQAKMQMNIKEMDVIFHSIMDRVP